MKIATRMHLGFGFVIGLLLLIAIGSIVRLGELSQETDAIAKSVWPKLELAQRGLAGVNDIAIGARDMVLATDPATRDGAKAYVLAGRAAIGQAWEALGPMLVRPEGQAMMAGILEARQQFIVLQDRLIMLVGAGRRDEASALLVGDFRRTAIEYRNRVNALIGFQGQLMTESAKAAEDTANNTRSLIMGLSVVAVLSALLATWLISRGVVRSLQQAIDAAQTLARGDLDLQLGPQGDDEAGRLLAAMQGLADKLRHVLGSVREAADGIAGVARQVSVATAEVSRAGEAQAEASSSSAAALEQVTVSVNEVSSLTRETEASAARTSETARSSVAAISQAGNEIDAMLRAVTHSSEQVQALLRRSEEVGGIAGVIREIADQTNLLALNAAIEAARAGEQGRGFAVVADEVRKLAERTAQATHQIAEVIGYIQNETQQTVDGMHGVRPRIEDGLMQVRTVAAMLDRIVSEAEQSRVRAADVASASHEQATAANAIAGNVEQVAQMVERNAGSLRENAAGAARLEQMAAGLREKIGYFRFTAASSY